MTLWLSYGTRSDIHMYINAAAECVMLYIWYDFHNIIFKINHKLYKALGSPPPPQ
jgi:hypothetical protein